VPSTIKAFTDAAADAVGREIASLRREAQRERELRDAEHRARLAELETRLLSAADLERRLSERLDALRDGEPGPQGEPGPAGVVDMGEVRAIVTEAVAAIPAAEPGRDADMEAIERQIAEGIELAVQALPTAKDGEPGRDGDGIDHIEVEQDGPVVEIAFTVGEERSAFQIELPSGPQGERGAPGEPGPQGKLAVARAWEDRVHYEGEVVTLDGSTYQALRDTGRQPPAEDWALLASRGADGAEARGLMFLGTYAAENDYERLNVVALNGASFVAKTDNPGPCPGEGWQLMAAQGKRGAPGERGPQGAKGDRGAPGAAVAALSIDDDGLFTLTNGDGSTVACDLYPLLSRLGR
jgi:hypothetical protein